MTGTNLIKWGVLLLALLPVGALAFFKPSRVLVPEAFGARCDGHGVCVDDAGKLAQASGLYEDARRELKAKWGLTVGAPVVMFCSTRRCEDRFGVGRRAGFTVGTLGSVMARRGWTRYYVEHELIHHWQAHNFGNLALWSAPGWLVEGMAYSLSGDPRHPLAEPFESDRRKFDAWRRDHVRLDWRAVFRLGAAQTR